MEKPEVKPNHPFFSSGPCSKRPGWNLEALNNAVLGRSHRAKSGKAKLNEVIVKSIDVSEHFTDNTTIEKYNQCVIINDIIYAFPYGESDSFQTVLVFDTIKEQVIKTFDLNDV